MGIKIQGFSSTGGGGGGGGGGPEPQYGTAPTYNSIGLGSGEGGIGLVQVSYTAPANSTSLLFVQTDKSADVLTDGYAQGWNQINFVNNNGATWWDYIWLSSQENSSQSSAIATSNGFLQGNWIGIVESLIGVSAPPTINTFFNNSSQQSNVSIVTNVNINDGEIAVLFAGAEGHTYAGGNITSVTSTSGITWTRKSSRSNVESPSNNSALFQTGDIWYAINNTGNTISGDNVTITYVDQYDDQSAIVSTWSGVDLNNPWA